MEILQFIFSSFWIFLGTLFLVIGISRGIARIILAFFGKRLDGDNS